MHGIGHRPGTADGQGMVANDIPQPSLAPYLNGFEFEPTHNGGTAGDSKGFQPNGCAFTIPLSSRSDELGAALRKAFSLCTTIYERPSPA